MLPHLVDAMDDDLSDLSSVFSSDSEDELKLPAIEVSTYRSYDWIFQARLIMVLVLRFCIFCGSQLKYSPPVFVFISRHMEKGWDWHTVYPLVDNGQTTPYLSEKWVNKIKIQLLIRTSCDALSYIMMCLPVIQKYFY